MAIVNRTLDTSEQRKVLSCVVKEAAQLTTGITSIIAQVPWPCVLEAVQHAAYGISGAPTVTVLVNRFIVGTGATAINLTAAMALNAYGTSGSPIIGGSLLAAGSTLLNLLPNDVLQYQTGGANSACLNLSVSVVVRPIQDVKKNFAIV